MHKYILSTIKYQWGTCDKCVLDHKVDGSPDDYDVCKDVVLKLHGESILSCGMNLVREREILLLPDYLEMLSSLYGCSCRYP